MKTMKGFCHAIIKDRDGNVLGQPARPGAPSQRAFERARTEALHQKIEQDRAQRRAAHLILAGDHPAPTVQEDLQAVRRRPLDAPMATSYRLDDVVEPVGLGRITLALLLLAASFLAGLIVGRLA